MNNINWTKSLLMVAGVGALDYALDRKLTSALIMGAAAAILYNIVAQSSLGGTSP